MKIIAVLVIMLTGGYVALFYKNKLKQEYLLLNYIKEFFEFYVSNIELFKENIDYIINNYIIMQKNKIANYNNIFLKNDNIYKINEDFINKTIKNNNLKFAIINQLKQIGKSDFNYEKEKSNTMINLLSKEVNIAYENYNKKGSLYFKIIIAIAAVVSVLIWWFYGSFNSF